MGECVCPFPRIACPDCSLACPTCEEGRRVPKVMRTLDPAERGAFVPISDAQIQEALERGAHQRAVAQGSRKILPAEARLHDLCEFVLENAPCDCGGRVQMVHKNACAGNAHRRAVLRARGELP